MKRILAAVAVLSCAGACDVSTTVIETMDRSDARASAIVERIEGNATVSFIYRVSIVGKSDGDKPMEILKIDHSGAPKVAWQENGSLQIDAPCGNISKFTNFATLRRGADYEMVPVILKNDGLCPRS